MKTVTNNYNQCYFSCKFANNDVIDICNNRLRDASGGKVRDASGGKVRDASGGNVRDASGGNVRDASGGKVRDASGGNVRDASGGNVRDASSQTVKCVQFADSIEESSGQYFRLENTEACIPPEIWEEEFFKRFEWLKNKSLDDDQITAGDIFKDANSLSFYNVINQSFDEENIVIQNNKKLKNMCAALESIIENFDKNTTEPYNTDPTSRTLYLYFVALEEDKMILHASFKRSFEQILVDCETLYHFAKVYKPRRVVYVMENIDLYDVDKNVKIFMNMFGIDETRGGSYTDVILPKNIKHQLEEEFKIADIEFYLRQEKRLNLLQN